LFCHKCGTSIAGVSSKNSGKLTIYGYTQFFLVNPKIDIYKDDVCIGKIGKGEVFEVSIERDCQIKFSCLARTAICLARSGVNQSIKIEWDRLTGGMNIVKL
jgi:hypothetical protein